MHGVNQSETFQGSRLLKGVIREKIDGRCTFAEKNLRQNAEKRRGWRNDGRLWQKNFFEEGIDKDGFRVYIKQA